MSAIYDALVRLNGMVENLEGRLVQHEKAVQELRQQKVASGAQPDLFSKPANRNGASMLQGASGIDPSILASRLDIAIEKVEQVLREG